MEARDRWYEDDEEGGNDPLSLAMREAEKQVEQANQRNSGESTYQYPNSNERENRGSYSRTVTKDKPTEGDVWSAEPKGNILDGSRTANDPLAVGKTTASDGQSLQSQDSNTQMNFRMRYGAQAEQMWVKEHEKELENIRKGFPAQGPDAAGGQAGTGSAIMNSTKSPAVVARAGATTAASGVKPWLAQGWLPAPTDVVTITLPDGQTATMTGAYYIEQATKTDLGTNNRQQYISSVTLGTDATPRLLSGQGAGPTTNTSRDPATIGAPNAPSALVGSGTAQPGAATPASVPSAQPSSAAPGLPTGAPPKPASSQIADPVLIKHADGSYYWQGREYVQPSDKVAYDPKTAESPPTTGAAKMSNNVVAVGSGSSAVRPASTAVSTPNMSRPLDSLVQMTGKPPEEARRIAQGISALMHGDASGAWTEPYLNDVARLAWAEEQKRSGKNVDPLDAPEDYLEAWKDGFMGSDHSIPLVKEMDQQMIDYAAEQSSQQGKPFDWRLAYGPTGEDGLISRQVTDRDCGTNSFSNVMRSYGYNADPATTYEYGKAKGYHDGEQFTGPYNFSRMLREEAGINAQTIPMDWATVDRELDAGRVVVLSSGGHYWTVSAKRDGPNGTEYYGGATSKVVSNPEWATSGQIRYGGAPNYMIVTSGGVDPNSRAVQEMGLKPPGGVQPNNPVAGRALMSGQTRANAEQRIRMGMQQNATQNTAPDSDENIMWEAATRLGADPVLGLAVLDVESGGDATATSGAGARGKMQLMPETARSLGVTDITDPRQNINGGMTYLKQMLDRYDGNLDLALAAYNAGPGAVDRYGGIPPYQETQNYIRKVKAAYAARQQTYERAK